MDKFGIFKLLNSFYDYYKQNTENQSTETQNTPEEKEIAKPTPSISPSKPLQTSMLKTISSHDEIVHRVINNIKKQ